MAVKTRLGEILKIQGRSNRWLAKQMKKSSNTISLWVTGKVSIPLDELYELSEHLGVPVKDFLYDSLGDTKKEKLNEPQSTL